MSFGSIPPIDQSLLPASVRNGTTAEKQAYTTALGFEQMLVDQLSQELASTSQPDASSDSGGDSGSSGSDSSLLGGSDAATNTYAELLPTALTSSVMSAGGLGIAQQLASALDPTHSSGSSSGSTSGSTSAASTAGSTAATTPAVSSVASSSPSEASDSSESSEPSESSESSAT